jgi:hypothetical protein
MNSLHQHYNNLINVLRSNKLKRNINSLHPNIMMITSLKRPKHIHNYIIHNFTLTIPTQFPNQFQKNHLKLFTPINNPIYIRKKDTLPWFSRWFQVEVSERCDCRKLEELRNGLAIEEKHDCWCRRSFAEVNYQTAWFLSKISNRAAISSLSLNFPSDQNHS